MLHGMNQYEAQLAAAAYGHEVMRREFANQHALRAAGIGRKSYFARVMSALRRQLGAGSHAPAHRPISGGEAYGD